MLEDRSYMRQSPFDARRSLTLTLVIVNAAAFLVQLALERVTDGQSNAYLTLSTWGLAHGYIWQLLTYQFMHANLVHLLVNCWAIYVFGREVEEALGRASFLKLYLASGVVGGLVQVLAGFLVPTLFGGAVVGASAAGFGLAAAFAVLFPDRIILLFFIIPLRAKYLLWLSVVLALAGLLSAGSHAGGGVRIADGAHLGGMLAGFLYVRYGIHLNWRWPRWGSRQGRPPKRLVRVISGTSAGWGRGTHVVDEDLPPEEFLSREVDPILDKISAQGIQSLTERERRILEAAREKMGRR